MPYNFAQQRGLGKWGERQVVRHFEDRGYEIKDVSEDKEYQSKGIDFLMMHGDGDYVKADVKTDMLFQRTGNLFIETKSSKDKIGCALSTEASTFLYFCPLNKKTNPGEGLLFSLNMPMFKEWYAEHEEMLRRDDKLRTVKNEGYESEGIAFSSDLLKELGFVTVEDIAIK